MRLDSQDNAPRLGDSSPMVPPGSSAFRAAGNRPTGRDAFHASGPGGAAGDGRDGAGGPAYAGDFEQVVPRGRWWRRNRRMSRRVECSISNTGIIVHAQCVCDPSGPTVCLLILAARDPPAIISLHQYQLRVLTRHCSPNTRLNYWTVPSGSSPEVAHPDHRELGAA